MGDWQDVMPSKNTGQVEKDRDRQNKLRRFAYTAAIASIIVAILSGILTLPGIPAGAQKIGDLHPSFLRDLSFGLVVFISCFILSVFLIAVVFMWEIHYHLDSFGDRVTGLEENLDRKIDGRYLGTGSAALTSILDRAKEAQEVRNTLVLFGVPEHDVAAACYTTDQTREIHKCIKEVLLQGGSWTDIVSQEVVNSSSLNWLGFITELRTGHKDKAEASLERYKIRRLKELYPVINFMLLRYENDDEEAIFGWGHHSEDPGGRVFMTKSPRLIAVFDFFWRMLEKDSMSFMPDERRPIAPADITGLWFSTAYAPVQNWDDPSGGIPSGAEFLNAALVSIGISDNRNITLKGIIVEPDGNQRQIDSVSADLEDCQLWFSTRSSGTLFNAGWYRFISPPAPDAQNPQTFAIQEFYGHFLDPEKAAAAADCKGEQHYKIRNLMIFGKRITQHWPPGTGLRRDPGDLPEDPKVRAELIGHCKEWWDKNARARWKGPSIKADTESSETAGRSKSVPPAPPPVPPPAP
jgi:hypothetical protein